MSIKQSLEENKEIILEKLPTEELKQEFLASLNNVEQPAVPTAEEQIKEAEAQPHVEESMYADIQKELTDYKPVAPMTPEEEQAAIEAGVQQNKVS